MAKGKVWKIEDGVRRKVTDEEGGDFLDMLTTITIRELDAGKTDEEIMQTIVRSVPLNGFEMELPVVDHLAIIAVNRRAWEQGMPWTKTKQ